jgi:hypothetical protein
MSMRDVTSGRTWEVGSHWNRKKLRDNGTGIHWNVDRQMWELTIVHHGGYYHSSAEAVKALETYLTSTEYEISKGASLQEQMNKNRDVGLLVDGELLPDTENTSDEQDK